MKRVCSQSTTSQHGHGVGPFSALRTLQGAGVRDRAHLPGCGCSVLCRLPSWVRRRNANNSATPRQSRTMRTSHAVATSALLCVHAHPAACRHASRSIEITELQSHGLIDPHTPRLFDIKLVPDSSSSVQREARPWYVEGKVVLCLTCDRWVVQDGGQHHEGCCGGRLDVPAQ